MGEERNFSNSPDEKRKKSTKNFDVFFCVQAGTYTGAEHTGVITEISGVVDTMRPVWNRGLPRG